MANAKAFTEKEYIDYLRVRDVLERAIRMVEVATFKKLAPAFTDEDILVIIDRIYFFGGAYGSVPYQNTEEWHKFNDALKLYKSTPIEVAFRGLPVETQDRLQTFAGSNLLAEAKQRKEQWEKIQASRFSVPAASSCGGVGCRGGRSRKQRKTKRRARR